MPKRPNPFGESSPLQFKTHIGKKEVDMGVNMEENMQNVYERTKSLLYQGSKKVLDCPTCNDDENGWVSMETREELRPLPGQLRFDSEGHLQANTEPDPTNHKTDMVENDTTEVEMEAVSCNGAAAGPSKIRSPSKQLQINASGKLCSNAMEESCPPSSSSTGCRICHSCNRPIHISIRQCNFCDKSTCNNCVFMCYGCQGLYCRVCCVINYDDCVEKPFCLQCSS